MKRQSTVFWNNPKESQPIHAQTILVIYQGLTWAGGYANGKVILYPEDFEAIQLKDCQAWAALPRYI